jgi:hypothetical protein
VIISKSDEERELLYKIQKVEYVLSKKSIEEQITYLLNREKLNSDDFLKIHMHKLHKEFAFKIPSFFEHIYNIDYVREIWNLLKDEDRLKIIRRILCYNDFASYLKVNIEEIYSDLSEDISKIKWLKVFPYRVEPREVVIEIIKDMMDDEYYQRILKERNIDPNARLETLSDEELAALLNN